MCTEKNWADHVLLKIKILFLPSELYMEKTYRCINLRYNTSFPNNYKMSVKGSCRIVPILNFIRQSILVDVT